jgi:2-hydroxy-6-oxonona-2,4-dienedioate hydrolase
VISYPIRVAGTMTRVIEAGTSGTPFVFVHGVSAYAHRWHQNLEPIAAGGHRCYAFDLPGHGFAAKGSEFEYTVPGYATFLTALMDTLDANPAILVGTSLGGHIAATVACRSPERLSALVLVGSLGIVAVGEAVRRLIANAILNTSSNGIREKLRRAHADASVVSDELVEEEFRLNNSYGAQETWERLAHYLQTRLDEDCVGEQLSRLCDRIPMLLVWGEMDRSVGLNVAAAAHRRIPGSRLVVIRGAGHAPYFERPLAFNRAMLDFLAGAFADTSAADTIYR